MCKYKKIKLKIKINLKINEIEIKYIFINKLNVKENSNKTKKRKLINNDLKLKKNRYSTFIDMGPSMLQFDGIWDCSFNMGPLVLGGVK